MRRRPFRSVSVFILIVFPVVVQVFRTSMQVTLQSKNNGIELETFPTSLRRSTISLLPTEDESNNSIGIDLATARIGGEEQEPIPHNFVFHSWGPEGIDLQPILRFINYVLYQEHKRERPNARQYNPVVGFVVMHNGSRPMMWFPMTVLRQRNVPIIVGGRLSRMLVHFQQAVGTLLFDYPDRFQAIIQVLEKVGSFPIILDLSDYGGCANDKYKMPSAKKCLS